MRINHLLKYFKRDPKHQRRVIITEVIPVLFMRLEALQRIYEHNGVVKIDHMFSREEINSLRLEYDSLIETRETSEIYRDEPLVVLWTHVVGAQKKTCRLSELPGFKSLIYKKIAPFIASFLDANKKVELLQLLEVIVFNKPPQKSNVLNWHQDVAYFPVKPNNQVAVWFPLSDVNSEMGPMVYAHGSHKLGIKGSTNLHTREVFEGEDRELIPDNPQDIGLEVQEYPLTQEQMLIHDGYTWHYSKPNRSENSQRMGVSVRFLTETVVFDPRPGQGAAFTKQIDVKPGDKIESPCFPIVWKRS
ncbi:Hypothetical protein P9303_23361 [Prochlorococcus marinus str. MIT 9303]|uniref:Phytanoyl-CoA dioxygenase n=1 Tax=Prochlorococcus marinus (strain MIT 9303) TaxID=59922 RepID=A2CC61_PROM3|nr:Hypothetical protein P9303_23361 [Prochlorococcus marinus str. MIT 9303]